MRKKKWSQRDLQPVVAGLRGEVRFGASLKEYTSFHIGGPADVLVQPRDLEDLCRLVRQARQARAPLFVLGGTNVLVRDGGIRGVVVSLGHLTRVQEEPNAVLYSEAGIGMPKLMQVASKRGLSGLEWAAGIPGTLGGCIVMNAGTKLGEMSGSVKAVRMVSPEGEVHDYLKDELSFRYRRSTLPEGIVAGAWLQLKSDSPDRIAQTVKDYLRYRKETQPLSEPNAGCVFKNPAGQTAGGLVEQAGLKGRRVGDAEVSSKHANFIVNRGAATARDVATLIAAVKRTVRARTGQALELEVKIVGEA
jgi:UDP-N-acetylmuramate dehydrogenase